MPRGLLLLLLLLLLLHAVRRGDGLCSVGFEEGGDSCFSFTSSLSLGHSAGITCAASGAALAVLDTRKKLSEVRGDCAGKAWVALFRTSSGWVWEGGRPMNASLWAPGHPSLGECAYWDPTTGLVKSALCLNLLPPLCEEVPVPGHAGWVASRGYLYKPTSVAVPWGNATQACRALHPNALPMSVHSIGDLQLLLAQFCSAPLWLGGYCSDPDSPQPCYSSSDDWRWSDGTRLNPQDFDPFGLGYPSGHGCIGTRNNIGLADYDCTRLFRVVCSLAPSTPSPPSRPSTPTVTAAVPRIAPSVAPQPSTAPPAPVQSPYDAELTLAASIIGKAQHRVPVSYMSAASVALSALVGAPLDGAQLAVLVRGCVHQGTLPVLLHPTQLEVGDSDERVYIGCLVGNLAIVAGIAMAQRAALALTAIRGGVHHRDAGALRYPALSLLAFTVVYQGAILSALHITFHGSNYERLGGTLVTFFLCGCAVYVGYSVRPVKEKAVYYTDPSPRFVPLIGKGEWLSKSDFFVERYGLIFAHLTPECSGFIWTNLCFTSLLGLTATVEVDSLPECGVLNALQSSLCVIHLVVTFIRSPHLLWRNTLADCAKDLALALACLFTAVAYYTTDPSHWGFEASGVMFMVAAATLLLRGCLDVLSAAIVLATGRRGRLQQEMTAELMASTNDKSDEPNELKEAGLSLSAIPRFPGLLDEPLVDDSFRRCSLYALPALQDRNILVPSNVGSPSTECSPVPSPSSRRTPLGTCSTFRSPRLDDSRSFLA